KDAAEPGEADRRRLIEGLGRNERRCLELAREGDQVGERPLEARGGRAFESRASEPERLEHGGGEVLAEGHLGALGKEGAELFEAGVRVDASLAGLRDRPRPVEGETGSVTEQMANGGARRARRLVEVDDA